MKFILPIGLVCITFTICGLVDGIPERYFVGYRPVHEPRLEKRHQLDSELTTHMKEKSKAKRNVTRHEGNGKIDPYYANDDYDKYNTKMEYGGQTPEYKRFYETVNEDKEALRYERKRDKQREVTDQIKHEPVYHEAVQQDGKYYEVYATDSGQAHKPRYQRYY